MIVISGRIPILIHPFFWLTSFLIGWLYSQSLLSMLIWVGIVFISVLVHEYGHALTAAFFRQKVKIQLVAFGGLTSYEGEEKLHFWQQFLIVLNGPLFGLGLCLLASFFLMFSLPPLVSHICRAVQLANLLWSVLNLIPVIPLDGGQLLRIALEAMFGVKGFKASLLLSAFLAGALSCIAFVYSYLIAGAFFFLFAFQSFDTWRKSRFATGADRSQENSELMEKAERALQEGKKEEAKVLFEKLVERSPQGVLAIVAEQYLAFFDMQQGKQEKAYQRLLPLKEHLAEESLCLLHQLAFEHANDLLVSELSSRCYQMSPTREVAFRNARSFARLKNPEQAGGWLQTAWQHAPFEIEEVLSESAFLGIKENPIFLKFVEPLQK